MSIDINCYNRVHFHSVYLTVLCAELLRAHFFSLYSQCIDKLVIMSIFTLHINISRKCISQLFCCFISWVLFPVKGLLKMVVFCLCHILAASVCCLYCWSWAWIWILWCTHSLIFYTAYPGHGSSPHSACKACSVQHLPEAAHSTGSPLCLDLWKILRDFAGLQSPACLACHMGGSLMVS